MVAPVFAPAAPALSTSADVAAPRYASALAALPVLFFSFGFITCLNDILVPYHKAIFQLSYAQADVINLWFFGAYFVVGIPVGLLVKRIGYKGGMLLGFVVAAGGCFLSYPAANSHACGLFLGALFVLATGVVLQVAGNSYLAALGLAASGPARLIRTQALHLNPQRSFTAFITLLALLVGVLQGAQAQRAPKAAFVAKSTDVATWLTTPDKSVLFQLQPGPLKFGPATAANPTIEVDEQQKFQTIDGFGYCLTGGSAQLLHQMGTTERAKLLRELFATDGTNIGVSYLRVSIGASDLDDRVFSYDDLPAGQTDAELAHFSLAPDQPHLIPVLKEILAINPTIKILASPWSPPMWMKTNGESKGGSLKPEYYDAYARYFVKYLRGMKAAGIRIDAITVQNEPLHPGNNPSLLMLAEQQADFIRKSLGPAFRTAKLDTKIIVYDHNADKPEYPLTILADAGAAQYVDGSAFHLYAGSIEALSKVHDAHPDKNVYFTEEWVGSKSKFDGNLRWHVKNLIIGATRNWARNVLEWNLAADPQQNPHTPGGCTECLGALTLAGNAVTRNEAYYIIAHASKFARPGSVRIASTLPDKLPNVAFLSPGGQRVLVVLNDGTASQTFNIGHNGRQAAASLPAGAVGTYIW